MNPAESLPTIAGVLVVLAAVIGALFPLIRRDGRAGTLDAAEVDRAEQRFRLYRQVLDLELDRDTGKLSAEDFQALSADLLRQAAALLDPSRTDEADLDAAVEREIAAARAAFHTLRQAQPAQGVAS